MQKHRPMFGISHYSLDSFDDPAGRSTLRPFGPEPFDPELTVEGLKAEGLSTGSGMGGIGSG